MLLNVINGGELDELRAIIVRRDEYPANNECPVGSFGKGLQGIDARNAWLSLLNLGSLATLQRRTFALYSPKYLSGVITYSRLPTRLVNEARYDIGL